MSLKNWLRGSKASTGVSGRRIAPLSRSETASSLSNSERPGGTSSFAGQTPPRNETDAPPQSEKDAPLFASASAPGSADAIPPFTNAIPPGGGNQGPPDGTVPPAGGDEPPPPTGGVIPVSLEEVTRGMQLAASAANQLIAHQYMQTLDPYFEHLDDGSLAPRTLRMHLDEKHHLELPLVALATPRGLMLEKMKVHLTIRTDAVDTLPVEGGQENVSRFQVSLSPPGRPGESRDSRHVDIEMQFTVLEPPESVMRLIEEYTNRLVPKPNATEDLADE